MNDTHRSTPAFDSLANRRAGERTSGVADALRTRTTGADGDPAPESSMPIWWQVEGLRVLSIDRDDIGWNAALDAVRAVLERRGFTADADSLVEPIAESIDDRSTVAEGWTDRGRAWLQAGAPIGDAFNTWRKGQDLGQRVVDGVADRALREAHRQSTTVVEMLDPSPEEQRANFERIARTPRPTAVEIRSALITAGNLADQWRSHGKPGWGEDTQHLATMLDRLGVEVLVLDLDRDDMRAQLDRIAANAQPVEGTDLAELVQRARRTIDALSPQAVRKPLERDTADLIGKLVGAVNDQARKLREAEQLIDDCWPVARLVNDWATWSDASLYAYADAIIAKFPPDSGKQRRDAIVDALAEIRTVARDRLGDDGYTIPPAYDDNQREAASTALRRIALGGHVSDPESFEAGRPDSQRYGRTIDVIAAALGMRRAGA